MNILDSERDWLKAELQKRDILHWLWGFETLCQACAWVCVEEEKDTKYLVSIAFSLREKLMDDTNFLTMKPQSVIEAEKVINEMCDNEHSVHRQNYEIESNEGL